jgi:hypothetical protein
MPSFERHYIYLYMYKHAYIDTYIYILPPYYLLPPYCPLISPLLHPYYILLIYIYTEVVSENVVKCLASKENYQEINASKYIYMYTCILYIQSDRYVCIYIIGTKM